MFIIKEFTGSWRDGSAVKKIRDWFSAPAQYDSQPPETSSWELENLFWPPQSLTHTWTHKQTVMQKLISKKKSLKSSWMTFNAYLIFIFWEFDTCIKWTFIISTTIIFSNILCTSEESLLPIFNLPTFMFLLGLVASGTRGQHTTSLASRFTKQQCIKAM